MGCFTMDFLLNSLLYFLLSIDSPFQPDKGDIQMFQQQLQSTFPAPLNHTHEPKFPRAAAKHQNNYFAFRSDIFKAVFS